MTFAGAVLAGGASSRMGRDKAFIAIDGVALVSRGAQALSEAGATRVVVVGGDAPRLGELGLAHVADQFPGEGPLGGLLTALADLGAFSSDIERLVVLSCDLVQPAPDSILEVVAGLEDPAVDVAVPVAGDRLQWLHAAWHPRSHSVLSAAFDRGVRAPRHAARDLWIREIHGLNEAWFQDADRPEDLP